MNPQAIILGMYGMNALGTIRSLAKENIPSRGYHIRGKFPTAKYSKHTSDCFIVNNETELLEKLLKDGNRLDEKGVIFSTDDKYVLFCNNNYEQLKKYYYTPIIDGKNMNDCLNKKNVLQFGVAAGLNVPETYNLSEFSNSILSNTMTGPVMIKPVNSIKYDKNDMSVYDNIDKLLEKKDKLLEKYGEMIVQEYVISDANQHIDIQCYNSSKGVIIAGMHMLLDKMSNPGSDNKLTPLSIMMTSTWKDDLVEPSIKLAEYTKFSGPLNFEVIKTKKGYIFLEVNFRTSAYVYLDTVTGLNIPAIVYMDETGKDFSELLDTKRRLGLKMIREEREIYNSLLRYKNPFRCYKNLSEGMLSHYEKNNILPLLLMPLEIVGTLINKTK